MKLRGTLFAAGVAMLLCAGPSAPASAAPASVNLLGGSCSPSLYFTQTGGATVAVDSSINCYSSVDYLQIDVQLRQHCREQQLRVHQLVGLLRRRGCLSVRRIPGHRPVLGVQHLRLRRLHDVHDSGLLHHLLTLVRPPTTGEAQNPRADRFGGFRCPGRGGGGPRDRREPGRPGLRHRRGKPPRRGAETS